MKKIYLIFLLLLIPLAFSQPIAETVQNKLTIEFHAVTGTDIITLDLPKYFGKDAEFVHNHPEHVDISIDPNTHIATLRSKDPNWRGIETVIFATEMKYLNETEEKGGVLLPRNVTKVKINVSKEQIALENDAFTQTQFETILGNLTSEPVDVKKILQNTSLTLEINNQLKFNVSYKNGLPDLKMMWQLRPNSNMTAANYDEVSDFVTFTVIIFLLFALVVLILYIYYGYSEDIEKTLFAPRKIKKDVQTKILNEKNIAIRELGLIQRRLRKEKPIKLYRECTT
ncbi:hypothetical protein D6777_04290, partial [Candidatus Woesearchaeota archaeon]